MSDDAGTGAGDATDQSIRHNFRRKVFGRKRKQELYFFEKRASN